MKTLLITLGLLIVTGTPARSDQTKTAPASQNPEDNNLPLRDPGDAFKSLDQLDTSKTTKIETPENGESKTTQYEVK
jgi:hypothetical protein